MKQYDRHATYQYTRNTRKDILDKVPVDVYTTTKTTGGTQMDTEIWIGVQDHLPHEILHHITANNALETYVTETLSDFNAPITIDVSDVAPADATTPETKPDSSHQ